MGVVLNAGVFVPHRKARFDQMLAIVPPLPLAQARPCLSTGWPLFLGIFGTTVFVVPDVTWGLKTVYHTLPPDDVVLMILSHSRYFPSTAYRHLHLRDLLDVGDHVCLPSCVPHAGTVLSKHAVGVEPLFCLVFWDRGRACARGGRGKVAGPYSFVGGPFSKHLMYQ